MAVWVVRCGKFGEFEDYAINENVVGIDFDLRRSVIEFSDRDELREHLFNELAQGDDGKWVPNAVSQLWRFANELNVGDTVVLPCKQPKVVVVGRAIGEYRYEAGRQNPHIRSVEWDATDIPRASFDQDLLYSFGGLLTVFQVNRPNAEERIEQVVRQYRGGIAGAVPFSMANVSDEAPIVFDLDEAILDRISDRIRQKFTGHRLESLVANVLEAQGYTTLQTRRGPDGGIDVVAGKGQMGFEEPRLCVQVKSGTSPVDLPDYNRLQGNIRSFGAHHGLLVSLSGFTRPVLNENERSFFEIRLWDSGELTQNLLETYESLPADIRADIPLVDRKVLVETDI
jgi:restriction system protein